jgi:hypothetical protein
MRRLSIPLLLCTLACGDAGPRSGPGTLTATLTSPNGAEGAAVVEIFGEGIGGVAALDGRIFAERRGDTVRVVIVSEPAGALRFSVEVSDTTRRPGGVVVEVADPTDQIRPTVSGYGLEFRR